MESLLPANSTLMQKARQFTGSLLKLDRKRILSKLVNAS